MSDFDRNFAAARSSYAAPTETIHGGSIRQMRLVKFLLILLSVLLPAGIIFLAVELAYYTKPTRVPEETDGVRLLAALIYAAVVVGSLIAFGKGPLRRLFARHGFTWDDADQAWYFAIATLVFNGLVHIVDRIGGHVEIWLRIPGNVALAAASAIIFGFHYVENHTNGPGKIRPSRDFCYLPALPLVHHGLPNITLTCMPKYI